MPYVQKILSAPNGTIFKRANNEIKNIMMNHLHLCIKYEKEKVGGKLTYDKKIYERLEEELSRNVS